MQRVTVFDFDGTIIYGDSIVDMLRKGLKQGKVSPFLFIKAVIAGALYHAGLYDAIASKRCAHSFLARMDAQERERFLRNFAQSLVNRARPEAIKQLQAHKAAGEHVILCSASGDCYMQYVAPLLHVDALLCTPCDESGIPCGNNCRGKEKVHRVQEYLQEHGLEGAVLVAGYGDTAGDAPILSQCKTPVLVRPRKKLKKLMPDATVVQWADIKKS